MKIWISFLFFFSNYVLLSREKGCFSTISFFFVVGFLFFEEVKKNNTCGLEFYKYNFKKRGDSMLLGRIWLREKNYNFWLFYVVVVEKDFAHHNLALFFKKDTFFSIVKLKMDAAPAIWTIW